MKNGSGPSIYFVTQVYFASSIMMKSHMDFIYWLPSFDTSAYSQLELSSS